MSRETNKPSKYLDLQGIRGLAIIVVLGYHFYPEFFPNGYLGVDQFFVISGFLMSMMLNRIENEQTCSMIAQFFYKRLKRILPLYFIFILISMICLYDFFPDTAVESNQESANQALILMSNREQTHHENYFSMISSAIDIFTHTWSLSLEVQFYSIFPIIFLIANKWKENNPFICYGIFGALSFSLFCLTPKTYAFNSVFTRIWQFLIGAVVHDIKLSEDNCHHKLPNSEKENERLLSAYQNSHDQSCYNDAKMLTAKTVVTLSNVFLVNLLILIILPVSLESVLLRSVVTTFTGFLIFISQDNFVLCNRFSTYMGDISYALYLIHWPVFAFWKLTSEGNEYLLFSALVVSIILAVIVHEVYEKWYLKLSPINVGVLVVLLFLADGLIVNKDEILDQINFSGNRFTTLDLIKKNMTVDDAIKLNHEWSMRDMKRLYSPTCIYESVNTPLGWCRHTGLRKTNQFKLALIGNSWASNHASLFYQECGHRAKSILQGSSGGCEVFYPTYARDQCKANLTDFVERIKTEKPDYVFVVSRFFSIGDPFVGNNTSFDNDPIYEVMKNQMLSIIPHIKLKLYIVDALPGIHKRMVSKIAPMVKNGTNLEEIDNRLVTLYDFQMARKRHAQLVKDCKDKCIIIDYTPDFFNKETNTYRMFDKKGFSYFTSRKHLTPHGLEHIRHIWTDVCARL